MKKGGENKKNRKRADTWGELSTKLEITFPPVKIQTLRMGVKDQSQRESNVRGPKLQKTRKKKNEKESRKERKLANLKATRKFLE